MLRLQRYVGGYVLAAVLLVSMALLGLFAAVLLADKISDMGGHYPLRAILIQVLLQVPAFGVANMGFSMLIGCLLGLGVLANQSELTVMRASGVSVLRIVRMVLRPMVALVLVVVCLSEFVLPVLHRYADSLLLQAEENERGWFDSGHGLWLRQDNDFLHFNRILPSGDIYGFARFAFSNKGELEQVQYSPHAIFEARKKVSHKGKEEHDKLSEKGGWLLQKTRLTRFLANSVQTQVNEKDTRWDVQLAPALLRVVVDEPQNMNITELYRYVNYLDSQGQDSARFDLVFWQKVLQPLAMLGLVLVAIAFVFGPMRSTTMGYRLFIGVMVGVGFRFSQDMLAPISLVYRLSPLMAVLLPIVVCWIVGLTLLLRTR